ncbi:MAG: glycosyltransferase family 39 protein [Chitinophagales bacterium]|nr:glycosyltransferase family 39 protein [Chitinophagales bacterium]MDW8393556.1 glycosyltransferase family 39 protein [Chitinophagales bacterium]
MRRSLEFALLALIVLTGAALRFYGFPNIPFWFDELSTWGRTGFTSFRQLIHEGVMRDTHPALVQVFLNYYRFVFGDSEAAFKLPFLLMGTASLYLIYRIGKEWFSASCGLLSAALLAVTQLAVMQSQTARPYASGLFLTLLMVRHWWLYLQSENESRTHLLWFVAGAVLCTYNHYFSLLQAVLVCGLGWFLVPAQKSRGYVLACVLIALLWLPHWPITKVHLQQGGIGGWLAAPGPDFFLKYLGYLTHFSAGFQLTLCLVAVAAAAANFRNIEKNRMRLIAFLLGTLPALIGFAYSVWRNPLLHYWVLLFSLPFLLLWLFSFASDRQPVITATGVVLLLAVGSFTLIDQRKHYDLFYHQPIEQAVRLTAQYERQAAEPVLAILNHLPKYMEYYLREEKPRPAFVPWKDLQRLTQAEFRQWLQQQHATEVVCSNLPYEQFQVVREFYPYLMQRHSGNNYDWYVFSRRGPAALPLVYYSDSFFNAQLPAHRPLGQRLFFSDSLAEYSAALEVSLDSMVRYPDDWVVAALRFSALPSGSEAFLVVELMEGTEQRYWLGRLLSEGATDGKGTVYVALRLRDYPMRKGQRLLKAYVWNKSRFFLQAEQLQLQAEAGNPWLYGTVEPIPDYAESYRVYLSK